MITLIIAGFQPLESNGKAEDGKAEDNGSNKVMEEFEYKDKSAKELRNYMVSKQIEMRGITDPKVLEAMRTVPRHKFVPEGQKAYAYEDSALRIGYGQTISQPYIVGLMTEILEIKAGDKVLEVGTGSGYQAAVLSKITENVYSVEIIEQLAERTNNILKELGYKEIKTKIGDGYYGWEEYAPFDGIIVTAAAAHIPPPLIDQLKPNGIMVVPVGKPYEVQTLMKVTKKKNGGISTTQVLPVSFVPLTGNRNTGEK